MKVTVKLHASLKRYSGIQDGKVELDLPDNTTVGEVINMLKINANEIGLVVVNNRLTNNYEVLEQGDILELFTMMKGG